MRSVAIILVGLCFFAVAGVALERSDRFDPIRQSLRVESIPTAMLRYGPTGRILKRLGTVRAIPNDHHRFTETPGPVDLAASVFQKKRRVGPYLFRVHRGGLNALPSSTAVKPEFFKPGWPLLSIWVDPPDLFDAERGIVTNPEGRGRAWERLCYVSYYDEGGDLRFASGAGLRLHGRISRSFVKSGQTYPWRNFRLYFRRNYGIEEFGPGLLFGPESQPIKTLVLRRDRYWPFVDAMTLELARHIGCLAPEIKQVDLYIDGISQGLYGLMEHLSVRQWRSHMGHADFLFYRYKSRNSGRTAKAFRALRRWAEDKQVAMTMEEAARHIDVDNYTRHLFSFMFCGDSDWRQGIAVRDETRPDPRWYWINWDMDHSFKDFVPRGREREIWEQEAVDLVLNKQGDLRATLLRRLRKESPEYRRYFVRLGMDLLNHRLSPAYLEGLVARHERLAVSYGFDDLSPFDSLRQFMKHRPAFVRKQMDEYFEAGPAHRCEVRGPDDIDYLIDGYPERAGYTGWYFSGRTIRVELADPQLRRALSHWQVNGRRVDGQPLELPVETETILEPVMRGPSDP